MTNWKTSLGGVLAALGAALSQNGDTTIKSIGGVLAALGALLMGLAAKDFNVTGGTKQQ